MEHGTPRPHGSGADCHAARCDLAFEAHVKDGTCARTFKKHVVMKRRVSGVLRDRTRVLEKPSRDQAIAACAARHVLSWEGQLIRRSSVDHARALQLAGREVGQLRKALVCTCM